MLPFSETGATGRHHEPVHRPMELHQRVVRAGSGLLLAAAAAGTGWAAAHDGAEKLTDRIDFGVGADASPSDDFAKLYDLAMDGFAVLGGAALVKVGGRQVRIALDPKQQALEKMAYHGRRGGSLKKAAAASALPVIAASMFGYSADIGDAVGGSQVDAVNALTHDFSPDTTILSNSGKPELATTPILANSVVAQLATQKATGTYGVDIIPMRYSWDSAIREKDAKNASSDAAPKILSAVMSFPTEVAGVKDADEKCQEIPVNAAVALGHVGDKFSMAGSTFTIKGTLNNSGPNVIPVAMTNDSYARCFASNPDQPYNLVALRGDKTEVNRFLSDSGVLKSATASQRVRQSTLGDFIHETDRTSKNNSNGIILIFAGAVGLAAAGMLAYKTKADFANNRAVNSMLSAGGMSNKDITRISTIRTGREALLSSLYAMPVVAGIDYVTALGTPGAANVAPNVATFLAVLGFSKVVGRIATTTIAPSEMHKLTPSQRGTQS